MNPTNLSTCMRALQWLAGELALERHPLAHVPAQIAQALFDEPVGVCRTCGGELPPSSGRGRPRVHCLGCSPRRGKVAGNSMLCSADQSTLTDLQEGAA